MSKPYLVQQQHFCDIRCRRARMPKQTKRICLCVAPGCDQQATDGLRTSTPMCQAHQVRVTRHGTVAAFSSPVNRRMPPLPLAERLAAQSIRDGEHLRWTGPFTKYGYPRFATASRWLLAHRAAYMIHVGPIPDAHEIDHICGQRWCIEPSHLCALTHTAHMLRHTLDRQRRKT